jgi:hypothetical protein
VPERVLQTNKGRRLASELEHMRLAMGYKRRPGSSFATGGFASPLAAPSAAAQAIFVNNRLTLSQNDIEAIGAAVMKGSAQGSERGLMGANKENNRRNRAERRAGF